MPSVETKRQREKRTVELMIRLYCHKNHGNALCPDCQALLDFAHRRVDRCPFMETKTFCSNCPVHCYRRDMRAKIRAVMAFSGPRMVLYHPVQAVRHLIESKKEKRRMEKNHEN